MLPFGSWWRLERLIPRPRGGTGGLNAPGFCVQTHFSLNLCGLNRREEQVPHTYEVISGSRKGENPPDLMHATQSGLAAACPPFSTSRTLLRSASAGAD